MKFQVAVANKEIAQVEKRLKKWTVFKKYFPRLFFDALVSFQWIFEKLYEFSYWKILHVIYT